MDVSSGIELRLKTAGTGLKTAGIHAPMGRSTTLTPQRANLFLEALRYDGNFGNVCRAAGVNYKTANRWFNLGEDTTRPRSAAFRVAVITATAIGKRAEYDRYIAQFHDGTPMPPVTSAAEIAAAIAPSILAAATPPADK